MTWEEKLMALDVMSSSHLEMRRPGDWFVMSDRSVYMGGGAYRVSAGSGATPEDAVEDEWAIYADLPEGRCVSVFNEDHSGRRYYRWLGYMWKELTEEEVEGMVSVG